MTFKYLAQNTHQLNTFRPILFFLLSFLPVMGQELPPVQNFSPETYSAENQNWAMTQGPDDFIYAANNSGLLEYDGARWRLYDSPNKTILRSVKAVGKRIYTGAYMEFGYWERQVTGLLTYQSLTRDADLSLIEDEQFWNIFQVDDLVLFQSLNRIYSYDTKRSSFEVFEPEGSIVKAFLRDKALFFQLEGKGLYRLQDGKSIRLSDASFLKEDVLVNFLKTETGYLGVTAQSGFFRLEENKIQRLEIPSETKDKVIYSCEALEDGGFMLGTISSGVIHLNADLSFDYSINQRGGIANNTVLSIAEDRDANVWLGLDNGISVINSKSAFKVFKDEEGKIGSVYTAARKGDFLYLGSNQGLFYRNLNNEGSNFQLIPATRGQVWSLNELGDALLCGHHLGTFVVEGAAVRKIADIAGTWQMQWLDQSKGLVLQGNYSGLYVLQKTGNNWTLRNKLEGFDISSRYFARQGLQTVYVSHEYKGVFKIEVNAAFTQVLDYRLIAELPAAEKAGITPYDGSLFYVFKEGVFKLNPEGGTFEKDTVLTSTFFKVGDYSTGKLVYDNTENKLWTFNEQEIAYVQPGILSGEFEVNRFALPAKNRRDIPGFENITPLGERIYLLGNTAGYLLFDLNKSSIDAFDIGIRTIQNSTRNGSYTYIDSGSEQAFENRKSNFRFSYSVPKYDKFKSVVYQYRLKGYVDQWSPWTSQAFVAFENLPGGKYNFEVRARMGEQISQNTATYHFMINRPWYFSITAWIIYAVLLMLLIAGIQVFNQRFYHKQKQRLIEINNRRIELAQSEKQREIIRLENEKLQQDVASKSRELAASTMNLVKKNELLNTIKKELEQAEQKNVKPVIRIIDSNLDPKKDWEFFKEAFNNADKDFLKKIKKLHPKLTPNDLKLCAYLRLNLTSKEIAPLLNISVRSVEIKRYRLRKKMDLEREDGLVEYILSI